MNDPAAMEAAAKAMGAQMPGGFAGLGGAMGLPSGLSGFGKKK
jgi:signal recognition particle subunit SRP54